MKAKKYDFRIDQINKTWSAEITRRVSSRKIHVSKRKVGFTTENDAREWGQQELTIFLKKLKDRNARRSQQNENQTTNK